MLDSSGYQVVIIRHGESEFNKSNQFCGWHDPPLSENGIKDTQEIAVANLRERQMQFDCIYTSVLQRARNTVEIIAKALEYTNVRIISDWRLNERHYGNLTGFNKRQMANKYGEACVQNWRRRYDMRPPPINTDNEYYQRIRDNPALKVIPDECWSDGESMKDTYERIAPVWQQIKRDIMLGQRILIVAHGTVARSLVKHIENITDEAINNVNIPNSLPFVYKFDEHGILIGSCEYLADAEYVKQKSQEVARIGK